MFTISANFITDIQGYIGNLFTDFLPLLILFIGLIVGAFIVEEILAAALFKNKEEEK